MTPDEKDLLQKTFQLAQENNEMLRKMQASMRTNAVMRWPYWILIIGLSAASFWLFQPYVNSLQSAINGIDGGSQSAR